MTSKIALGDLLFYRMNGFEALDQVMSLKKLPEIHQNFENAKFHWLLWQM
jgi:ADP-heptose:LPS heptosyltransferase